LVASFINNAGGELPNGPEKLTQTLKQLLIRPVSAPSTNTSLYALKFLIGDKRLKSVAGSQPKVSRVWISFLPEFARCSVI
jgi:hypothetical protein